MVLHRSTGVQKVGGGKRNKMNAGKGGEKNKGRREGGGVRGLASFWPGFGQWTSSNK